MSLQWRIIGSIIALLVLSLLAGAILLSLHDRELVALEVRTAFIGASHSVRDTLKSDVEHTVTLRQVVASFQGQRHVRAALVNEKGKVIVQSQVATITNPAPAWFARVMAPPSLSARISIALPKYPCAVVLSSDPRSEIAEVWEHARDAFTIMALFCAATVAAMSIAAFEASRFLRRMQSGLLAISNGSYNTRLESSGPPEFASLTQSFNHMADQLSAFSRSNRQLYVQLQNAQEEERSSVARDLHDEVGPYLFALQVDAKAVSGIDAPEALRLGRSMRETVGHIQRHVRSILRQLRPVTQLDFGLETALHEIVTFWKRRHPEIEFVLNITLPAGVTRSHEETVYRLVQESLNNAVRHGAPSRVSVTVRSEPDQLAVCIEDNGGGMKSLPGQEGGLGHAGMRERVLALGGCLTIDDQEGQGLRIHALLPLTQEIEHA